VSLLKSLGYVTIQTADIDRWRQFAFGILGFAEGKGPDPSALYLRMDERAARIIVVPGDGDRIATVGWEVRDHAALEQLKVVLDDRFLGAVDDARPADPGTALLAQQRLQCGDETARAAFPGQAAVRQPLHVDRQPVGDHHKVRISGAGGGIAPGHRLRLEL